MSGRAIVGSKQEIGRVPIVAPPVPARPGNPTCRRSSAARWRTLTIRGLCPAVTGVSGLSQLSEQLAALSEVILPDLDPVLAVSRAVGEHVEAGVF